MTAAAGRVTWTKGEVGTAGMGRRGFETLMVHLVCAGCGVGSCWMQSRAWDQKAHICCGVGQVERLRFAGRVWPFIRNGSAYENLAVWNGAAHCRSGGGGFEGTQQSGLQTIEKRVQAGL